MLFHAERLLETAYANLGFFVEAVVAPSGVDEVGVATHSVADDFVADVFIDGASNTDTGAANFKAVAQRCAVAVGDGIQAGAEIAGIEMHAACHFCLDLGESGGAGA